MNFTGSTPFTSPSGVEKEMRRAIPMQAGSVLVGFLLWVGSAFTDPNWSEFSAAAFLMAYHRRFHNDCDSYLSQFSFQL